MGAIYTAKGLSESSGVLNDKLWRNASSKIVVFPEPVGAETTRFSSL